jgi:hypothetical protein
MSVAEDVGRIADAAAASAGPGEELAGVLAVDTLGRRVYLCAFESAEGHAWLALGAAGEPLTDRRLVRDAASLAALCEVAEESAGAGYLDALGSASRRLEQALGESSASPFAAAMQAALGSVEELAADVESNYKMPLE